MQTIAVVTPIYATAENQRLSLLEATLKSVAMQERMSDTKIVHVLVDDGSTEDVQKHLRNLKKSFLESRYVSRQRKPTDVKSSANALNLGFDLILKGSKDILTAQETKTLSAICYLHSDDLFRRNSVQTRLDLLGETFVFGETIDFYNQGQIIGLRKWQLPATPESIVQRTGIGFPHHTTMWRTAFLKKVQEYVLMKYKQEGIFGNDTQSEDRDATLSSAETAIALEQTIVQASQPFVFYRTHNNSITHSRRSTEEDQDQTNILRKHFGEEYIKTQKLKQSLFGNLPWSLFMMLPNKVKKELRPYLAPVRDYFTGANKEGQKFKEELDQILSA